MNTVNHAAAVVSASALIMNDAGELLIVKPRMESGWDLPGGLMSDDVDPADTCVREVFEETNLRVLIQRLLVIDWAPKIDQGNKLLYVFHAVHPDRLPQLMDVADKDELMAVQFTSPQAALGLLTDRVRRRTIAALDALDAGRWVYLVDGVVPSYASRTIR